MRLLRHFNGWHWPFHAMKAERQEVCERAPGVCATAGGANCIPTLGELAGGGRTHHHAAFARESSESGRRSGGGNEKGEGCGAGGGDNRKRKDYISKRVRVCRPGKKCARDDRDDVSLGFLHEANNGGGCVATGGEGATETLMPMCESMFRNFPTKRRSSLHVNCCATRAG